MSDQEKQRSARDQFGGEIDEEILSLVERIPIPPEREMLLNIISSVDLHGAVWACKVYGVAAVRRASREMKKDA